MTDEIMEVRISHIIIGDRYRKDMGDIDALAASIQQVGLLQPIGIDSNYRLVFGERRLRAFRQLGRDTIPARIVHVDRIVDGEYAENEVRKNFTDSERVAIARAVAVELGERRGGDRGNQYTGGKAVNCPSCHTGETRDIAAKKAGYSSGKTFERATSVVDKGTPELVEAMDKKEVSVSAAANVVKAFPTPEQQREALKDKKSFNKVAADVRKAAKAAAIGDKKLPTPKEADQIARETGKATMASDGKFYTGATPEQQKKVDALLAFYEHLEGIASLSISADYVDSKIAAYKRAKIADQVSKAIATLQAIASAMNRSDEAKTHVA